MAQRPGRALRGLILTVFGVGWIAHSIGRGDGAGIVVGVLSVVMGIALLLLYSLQKGIRAETPQPTPMPTPRIADEIKKLAELKDKGVLTEEEFQVMKRKLLEKY